MKNTDQTTRLPVVQSLSKPQRPKSKSLQPCQCQYDGCGKMFSKRSNLKAHMRVHNGVLPYPCIYPGCAKRFRWKSSLKPHIKVHEASAHIIATSSCTSSAGVSPTSSFPPERDIPKQVSPVMNFPHMSKQSSSRPPLMTSLLSMPLNSFVPDSLHCGEQSPTTVMNNHIFDSSAIDKSEANACQAQANIESQKNISHKILKMAEVIEPQSNAPSENKTHVARVLFPETLQQNDIDLRCDSVLSSCQSSYATEMVGNNIHIDEDLWKNESQIIDPFNELPIGMMDSTKGEDLLPSSVCTSEISSPTNDIPHVSDSQWLLPIDGMTGSCVDMSTALYI